MKLLRAPAYAWRRTLEASLYVRGKVILRRYTSHYRKARRVYATEHGVTAPPLGEAEVRVIDPHTDQGRQLLPAEHLANVRRLAQHVDRAFERTANCRFHPQLDAATQPEEWTRDVPALRKREVLAIRLRDPFAIDGLGEVCEPLMTMIERTLYGSYLVADKVYVYRNPVSDTRPRTSWRWHFDNHPREMLKVMVYLTDVTGDTAPFEFLRDSRTGQPWLGSPLTPLFGDSRVPQEAIDSRLRDHWTADRICGPAGTVIVFDDNIVHRATLARLAHRDVVVFQVRPALFTVARHIDRWTGTFGDRAMSASPLDLERRPE